MASKAGAADVMERREGEVVASPALATAMEITPENLDSFHFHGDWSAFPLTAILCLPRDAKSATIIAGRYHVSKDYQMLVPRGVVDELVGIVLRLKRFLEEHFTAKEMQSWLADLIELEGDLKKVEWVVAFNTSRAEVALDLASALEQRKALRGEVAVKVARALFEHRPHCREDIEGLWVSEGK